MKPTRQIVLCAGMIALAATSAFSQTPTSGALLTITGTGASSGVNIKIYDSQIHSGVVKVVPTDGGGDPACTVTDQIPTDAYVLQGGSPTGCDPGDAFEITDSNTSGSPHQAFGHADVSNFHIETHYVCAGECVGTSATSPVCNTNNTICANPDTGFLTVTNNTGSPFTGTISLQGTSPISGGPFCPASVVDGGPGVASDTWTAGLAAGASVTLALGTPATDGFNPSDSSNCGGFNQGQTQTLVAGQTSTFAFGNDDYQITPLNSLTGDSMTITPIPVPAGFTQVGSVTPSSLFFDPGTKFTGEHCVAYKDFSAPGNPVCVEIQRECVGANSCGFLYTAQLDFSIDANSLPNGIGGASFLGKHGVSCPTNAFDLNIFFSYLGAAIDPVKGAGGGGASCFVAAFDPNATPIATGDTFSSFVGFQTPVSDTDLNIIKAGSAVPLKWQQFISPGVGLTNLSWCPLGPSSGDNAVCATSGVSAPWVFVGTVATSCTNDPSPNLEAETPAGGSGLQNFGSGNYQFNWKTAKGSKGCVNIVLMYDTGLTLFPAQFKYK